MSAIGPGDWVECVSTTPPPHADPRYIVKHSDDLLTLGAIYRVERIVPGEEFDDGEPGLELAGIDQTDGDGIRACFWFEQFRPLYRPKGKELLRKLMGPVPGGLPRFWQAPAEVTGGGLVWSGR